MEIYNAFNTLPNQVSQATGESPFSTHSLTPEEKKTESNLLTAKELQKKQAPEENAESQPVTDNSLIDQLVDDRWYFKFSYDRTHRLVTELVDGQTGNVIRQQSYEQTPSKGSLLHLVA